MLPVQFHVYPFLAVSVTQHPLGKTMAEADLKFRIGIVDGGLFPEGCAASITPGSSQVLAIQVPGSPYFHPSKY